MKTAQQEWQEFARMVGLPEPTAPSIQRTEMRRAFYAGQFAMFTFQMSELVNVSDAQAEAGLAARQSELEQFFRANFNQRS
jgi:hypothetical protein